MAEPLKILSSDTLKQAFPKLNKAIENAFNAMNKATNADVNSNTTLNRMRSLQEQVNTLVVNGDSSVEAKQARVNAEGKSYSTLQERLNSENASLKTSIEQAKEKLLNDYKNFYLDKASEIYLYDLQLAMSTVNQSISIDEQSKEIYATQAYNFSGDNAESFVISRLTLGGKLLDSMTVRYGGHGTTIGLEKVGNTMYIWSNMLRVDSTGSLQTQYLTRFPYNPGAEINIDHSSVEKIQEFPDRNQYANPIGDTKNGLLALRKTDTRTGRHSFIEVYKLAEYKAGTRTPIYTFHFTAEMDALPLQGTTIDDTNLYLTFGVSPEEHRVFQIDLITNTIVGRIARPIGRNARNDYEGGHGELEGLFLYTNQATGYKTLLTVVVTDAAGRRRQKLFALSWNSGVQEFLSYTADQTQNIKLTRDDGKAKRISGISSLSQVTEPGDYYLTTGETNLPDFPLPGVAGWFLFVSAGDTGGSVIQKIFRNSSVVPQIFYRIVIPTSNTASPWFQIQTQVMS